MKIYKLYLFALFSVIFLGVGCQNNNVSVQSDVLGDNQNTLSKIESPTSTIISIETAIDEDTSQEQTSLTIDVGKEDKSGDVKDNNTEVVKQVEDSVIIINKTPTQSKITVPSTVEKSPSNDSVNKEVVYTPVVISQPTAPTQTTQTDFCRNIAQNQSEVPQGMYRSVDGDCFPLPVTQTETVQQKPTITQLTSSPAKGRPGQTVTVSYKSENTVVCALSNTSNIQVPFVGTLANGDRVILLDQNDFKDNKFTFYLICADKDWNTATQTLVIPNDPVFSSPQPTSFFSANGGNIGNGATGNLNGVPYVVITPLKQGATATVELDGSKTYPLDANGTHFYFYDLAINPNGPFTGSCTEHRYIVKFSYSDQDNSNITGVSTESGFCVNNVAL